jgi:hypothetical protein
MTIFKRKNRDATAPGLVPPATSASPHALTNLDRLKLIRSQKVDELMKLNDEVVTLDTNIAWLERFPQAERIIELLRAR